MRRARALAGGRRGKEGFGGEAGSVLVSANQRYGEGRSGPSTVENAMQKRSKCLNASQQGASSCLA